MKSRISLPLLFTVLAMLLAGNLSASYADAQREVPPSASTLDFSDPAEVARATHVREEFGLSTDSAALSSLAKAAAAYVGKLGPEAATRTESSSVDVGTLGIPLSPSEAANIRSRGLVSDASQRIQDSVLTSPTLVEYFGGSYVDQAAGGVLHVLLLPGVPSSARDLINTAAAPYQVVYGSAKFNLESLNNLLDQLGDVESSRSGIGAYITSATFAVPDNSILVRVKADVPDSLVTASEGIWKPIGSVVIQKSNAFTSPSTSRNNPLGGPLAGGQWLTGAQTGDECSVGYSHVRDSAGRYLTLTAGHCNTNTRWYQGLGNSGIPIGSTIYNAANLQTNHGNCDCQSIGSIPGGSGTENYFTSNSGATTRLTQVAPDWNDERVVCVSGANSGTKYPTVNQCGYIVGRGSVNYGWQSRNYAGWTLTDAILTNITTSLDGDSGGPVVFGNYLYGINEAILYTDDSMKTQMGEWFAKANHINGSVGVTIGF